MNDIMGFIAVMIICGVLTSIGEALRILWRRCHRQRNVIMRTPALDERNSIEAFRRMNS